MSPTKISDDTTAKATAKATDPPNVPPDAAKPRPKSPLFFETESFLNNPPDPKPSMTLRSATASTTKKPSKSPFFDPDDDDDDRKPPAKPTAAKPPKSPKSPKRSKSPPKSPPKTATKPKVTPAKPTKPAPKPNPTKPSPKKATSQAKPTTKSASARPSTPAPTFKSTKPKPTTTNGPTTTNPNHADNSADRKSPPEERLDPNATRTLAIYTPSANGNPQGTFINVKINHSLPCTQFHHLLSPEFFEHPSDANPAEILNLTFNNAKYRLHVNSLQDLLSNPHNAFLSAAIGKDRLAIVGHTIRIHANSDAPSKPTITCIRGLGDEGELLEINRNISLLFMSKQALVPSIEFYASQGYEGDTTPCPKHLWTETTIPATIILPSKLLLTLANIDQGHTPTINEVQTIAFETIKHEYNQRLTQKGTNEPTLFHRTLGGSPDPSDPFRSVNMDLLEVMKRYEPLLHYCHFLLETGHEFESAFHQTTNKDANTWFDGLRNSMVAGKLSYRHHLQDPATLHDVKLHPSIKGTHLPPLHPTRPTTTDADLIPTGRRSSRNKSIRDFFAPKPNPAPTQPPTNPTTNPIPNQHTTNDADGPDTDDENPKYVDGVFEADGYIWAGDKDAYYAKKQETAKRSLDTESVFAMDDDELFGDNDELTQVGDPTPQSQPKRQKTSTNAPPFGTTATTTTGFHFLYSPVDPTAANDATPPHGTATTTARDQPTWTKARPDTPRDFPDPDGVEDFPFDLTNNEGTADNTTNPFHTQDPRANLPTPANLFHRSQPHQATNNQPHQATNNLYANRPSQINFHQGATSNRNAAGNDAIMYDLLCSIKGSMDAQNEISKKKLAQDHTHFQSKENKKITITIRLLHQNAATIDGKNPATKLQPRDEAYLKASSPLEARDMLETDLRAKGCQVELTFGAGKTIQTGRYAAKAGQPSNLSMMIMPSSLTNTILANFDPQQAYHDWENGRSLTPHDQRLLNRMTHIPPRSIHYLIDQMNNFTWTIYFVCGPLSLAYRACTILNQWLTDNRQFLIDRAQNGQRDLPVHIATKIDMAFNNWFIAATTNVPNPMILDFSLTLHQIIDGSFYISLPRTIADAISNRRDRNNNSSNRNTSNNAGGRAIAPAPSASSQETRVTNENQLQSLRVSPQTYQLAINPAVKAGTRVPSHNGVGECLRYQLRGFCSSNCPRAANHTKITDQSREHRLTTFRTNCATWYRRNKPANAPDFQ